MIILGLDALDKDMVERFKCKNLMQLEYGETDISEFKLERTVVLWASFLTGKNMEKEISVKDQWNFKLKKSETFFNHFDSFKAIDVPAFSHKEKIHEKERKLMKGYFEDKNSIEDYDDVVWQIHKENKKEFLNSLGKVEVIMGYFNLADSIGHISFGNHKKMKIVYEELDSITKEIRDSDDFILIISDHGMKAVGMFGDHTRYGFYSCNQRLNLKKPKITEFIKLIIGLK
jgi:hypothetical protein